jgi:hypothetical protein
VALVGLVFMARDGLTLGGLRHMAAQPADAVAGPAEAPAGEPPPGRPADAAQRGPRA